MVFYIFGKVIAVTVQHNFYNFAIQFPIDYIYFVILNTLP